MDVKEFIDVVKIIGEYDEIDYSDRQPALIEREKFEQLGEAFIKAVDIFNLKDSK